ncbi:MauE/DoxX family redox-associated membrane protein [Vreelandella arctica]|uniref:MauE/DoxX family redox-associated membrane protein n=1 Tax=Vreelandella arctica TaxID=3126499 RepID=UPI000C0E2B85|nr:MauE/DoxX family redox-associated membrane protein [Halomonas sp.]MBL1268042.1 hypothetical protein [Halomonas sp.]
MNISELVALTSLVLLALLFAQSAWHKTQDYGRFLGLVANYQLLPRFLEENAARGLIVAEVLLVMLFVFPFTATFAALGIGALLLVYAVAMSVNLLRGHRLIDCGCGGSAHPVAWTLVLRNLLLAALALLPAIYDTSQPSHLELVVAMLAGSALWLSYNVLGKIMENNRLLSNLRQT